MASVFVSYFVYPSVSGHLEWLPGVAGLRDIDFGRGVEEVAGRVNRALDDYANIDSGVCLEMALCSISKVRRHKATTGRAKSLITADIVDYIVNLTAAGLMETKYKKARDFGGTGGDCSTYNRRQKCPLDEKAWNLLKNSLSSTLF